MANENSKERIRIRYEVAALQGLTANPEIGKLIISNTISPGVSFSKYIAVVSKNIADEMIKLNNDGK